MRKLPLFVSLIGMMLAVTVIVSLAAAQNDGTSQTEGFDRYAMTANLVNHIIIPQHEAFITATESLTQAASAFADAPTAATLDAFQAAWLNAALAWEPVSLYGLSDIMAVASQVNKTPVNERFVERFIAEEPVIDAAFIGTIGSTSKGLPAIEYLIFDLAGDALVLERMTTGERAEARRAYAAAASEALVANGVDLLAWWRIQAEPLQGESPAPGYDLENLLQMITNEAILSVQNVYQFRLGVPIGIATAADDPNPELVISRRSSSDLARTRAALLAFRDLFNGDGTGANALGYADHLEAVGASFDGVPLAEVINVQIEAGVTLIDNFDQPLEVLVIDDPEGTLALYEALRVLVRYAKVDLMSNLGIRLTFLDNDGD